MSNICKGICERFEAHVTARVPKYIVGAVFCHTCDVFLTINGIQFSVDRLKPDRCKCCGQRIRKKRRYKPKIQVES